MPGPQGPVVPAFTEDEITYLGETLSKAFAQAQPDEWVVFGLTRTTSQGLNELTTGGGYVEGTLLHVVLANYRKAVTMASTRQLLWKRPLRPDAGPSYDLVAGKHQAIVRDPSSVSSLLASAPSELTIAYQALLLGEPVGAPGSQETSEGNQASSPSPKILPPLSSIGERLQVLKRLQAQGLITEEEYRSKKQQLLDRF
ncbi:MAG: SHOCT domain-containing protein [Nitrospira sp.]